MKNQLRGAKVVLRNGDPLHDLKINGERILSESTGEVNAISKKDLIGRIGQLLNAAQNGDIQEVSESHVGMTKDQIREENRQLIEEAAADPAKWDSLGASIVGAIEDRAERQGLLRRICKGATVRQGDVPRVELKTHQAQAIIATGPSEYGYRQLRGRVFTPDEFELKSIIRVSRMDLEQINGDLLDRAQQDGLQSIMVAEDRLWKEAADRSVGMANPVTYIHGELTPRLLSVLKQQVSAWPMPVTTAILAADYWNDIIGNDQFTSALDPVSKYELITTGRLGTLLGLDLVTDGFRAPEHRVLQDGELYVVADQDYHAMYTTRGGTQSQPTSGANQGSTDRGWLLSSVFSFTLANVRSVAKAQRA
ncbi:major head protein [Dickeya phage vB_DsoM_JA29]|uniref:Putative major capsid protein n=1 Tax=Dickeya phage vB_DsoM_JA29 TaxID=2283031 RepID=A0A384ZX95_9CAUD|nr:major head protein [Dickeya phage vB_DsoM_JA29]AXG66856.1 putative major capsid protein [Dickeya phage vB_DsoM_JA29]